MDSIDKSLAYKAFTNHIMNFTEAAMDGTPGIWDQLIDGEFNYDTPEDCCDGKYLKDTGVLEDSYERLEDIAVQEMFNKSPTDAIINPTINDRDPPSASRFEFPSDNGKCPHCGSDLTLKKGRFGDFYGCTSFPNCRYTCSVKQYGASVKNEKPKTVEKKVEEKPKPKSYTGLCPEVEYKGGIYSDPFGLRCGECALYLHGKKSCLYREWSDVEKERPACDMFISSNTNERLMLMKFLKRIREEMKNESE